MKKSLLLLSILSLAACTTRYASNGENIYLNAHNGPGLVVPKPLSDANISHFYDLPSPSGNPMVSIAPPQV